METEYIYIVQGRSDLVFTATTDHNHAKMLSESIEGSYISCWQNNKCIYTTK